MHHKKLWRMQEDDIFTCQQSFGIQSEVKKKEKRNLKQRVSCPGGLLSTHSVGEPLDLGGSGERLAAAKGAVPVLPPEVIHGTG